MLASRFFLLNEQIDKLMGAEYAQLCFVSRSSALTNEAFATTLEYFNGMGVKKVRPKDVVINTEDPVKPLKASSDDARQAMNAIFALDNRINRKVLIEPIENPHPRRRH